MRSFCGSRFCAWFIAFYSLLFNAMPNMGLAQQIGVLAPGDAVVTGFSGVVEPDPQTLISINANPVDETFIDVLGISARVTPLAGMGYLWDARVWDAESFWETTASEVGQVFGVALDDEEYPNIYLTATSAYGLQIVAPDIDKDGRPERLEKGAPDAEWMAGQWGQTDEDDPAGSQGGPGSIWKVDGQTGVVSLFANVQLDGVDNPGAALGNITYHAAQKQLFVSDLATGMIHRFGLDGIELDFFDHGVTGRLAAGKDEVAFDPSFGLDITGSDFDPEDSETWGFANRTRRVWGLAEHDGRLYYAVVGDSAIWSVGLDPDTDGFMNDARWELDVPKKPKKLPVSDIVFTSTGAMILAQRSSLVASNDYSDFANPDQAHLYRYWLESPDDPETPGVWIAEPEEYAVGFGEDHRATDGGIALGHGYTDDGYINTASCEASLWTTGDNLRRSEQFADALRPGGALLIDGLQGMPTGPVRQYLPEKNNTPPWISYMVDLVPYDTDASADPAETAPPAYTDATTQGWMGDVAILRACDGGGGSGGWPSDWPYDVESGSCTPGVDCPGTGTFCTPGVDCPPPPPPPDAPSCAKPEGRFICDTATGTWTYDFIVSTFGGLTPNTVKVSGVYPGHFVPGAPMISYSGNHVGLQINGGASGQTMGADLCFFDAAEMASGKPFACCKLSVDEPAPSTTCAKIE